MGYKEGTNGGEITRKGNIFNQANRLPLIGTDGKLPSTIMNGDCNGQQLQNFKAKITKITDTTYTLQDSEMGTSFVMTNASDITITVPDTLTEGWTGTFWQGGAGQLIFVGDGDMTVVNADEYSSSAKQYAPVQLTVLDTNLAVLSGYMA